MRFEERLVALDGRLAPDIPVSELTAIRDELRSRVCREEFEATLTGNRPPDIEDLLLKLADRCADAQKQQRKSQWAAGALGMSAGTSLVIGGVFGAIAATGGMATLFLIPIGAGALIVTRMLQTGSQLEDETLLFKQIENELVLLRERYRNA